MRTKFCFTSYPPSSISFYQFFPPLSQPLPFSSAPSTPHVGPLANLLRSPGSSLTFLRFSTRRQNATMSVTPLHNYPLFTEARYSRWPSTAPLRPFLCYQQRDPICNNVAVTVQKWQKHSPVAHPGDQAQRLFTRL